MGQGSSASRRDRGNGKQKQSRRSNEEDIPREQGAAAVTKTPTISAYDEIEQEFMTKLGDAVEIGEIWDALGSADGHGPKEVEMVTLSVIEDWLREAFPVLVQSGRAAIIRAYNRTCLLEGDGKDAWVVPAELPRLLANAFFFSKLYTVFLQDTADRERMIDKKELSQGLADLRLNADKRASGLWEKLAGDKLGKVDLDRFCDWYIGEMMPDKEISESTAQFVAAGGSERISSSRPRRKKKSRKGSKKGRKGSSTANEVDADPLLDDIDRLTKEATEEAVLELIQDVEKMHAVWDEIAHSDGSVVSPAVRLDDVGAWIKVNYPQLNHSETLRRAYMRIQESSDKPDESGQWVNPGDCTKLLAYLVYFNRVYDFFDQFDVDGDHSIDRDEFVAGVVKLGLNKTEEEAKEIYSRIDGNDDGHIYFDKFCEWYLREVMPQRELADTTAKFQAQRDLDFYLNCA